ncbi:MAG: 2-hydroxyacid dehydrogenase family protein [Ezakiella sp.]|nr:2-hydroxyacid dehydrogenase family protein [Ezakiella sp.]MDD7471303.1 2-hydroxyacid dehydrogenase family protein [Bacillota bacterium]MDY3923602.1 2-hydroxyacid dehydrogenase family protein [Ezakiella sp.]
MKVLITLKVPEKTLNKLKEYFEVDYNDNLDFLPKDILIQKAKSADAILCPLSEKIDAEIINSAKNLKIIANFGAGFDNIDIESATKNNVVVTNAPATGSTNSTAELTFALILDIMRGITRGEDSLRRGEFKGWKPTYCLGPTLHGKTLGIFGMGRIGQNLAQKANAFGMNVIYYKRSRLDEEKEKELNVKYLEFEEILKTCDVLSLNSSYTPSIHHLIGEKELAMMKKDAYLVNTSRGPVIDEKALAKALKDKVIKGAALDVYEFEPKVTEELLYLDNVVLSPHLGNATIEAREEMGEIAANNIIAYLNGKVAPNKVN